MSLQEEYRMILQTDYCAYVHYVHKGMWIPSKFHKFLCDTIQDFVETDTGHSFDILILSTPPQHGKLISDDTPVLTRDGWKRHGDLVVGDEVIGLDGRFHKVLYVFPKYFADREVTFTNGEVIKCHHNHEWYVYDRSLHRERTVETSYMQPRVSYGSQEKKRGHRYNFTVPIRKPLDAEEKPLKVHPYVLGAWL